MNAPVTRLGKYDLVRALGEGAMGVVYEAVDSVIERTVAIKTIRKGELDPDEAAEHGRRFLIEAKAAGKLNHPNIVGLYDHGDEGGLAYIVMELVQGRELQHYFNERYAFTLGDIVRLMGELLDALGYSHRRGVIHRDVKPANIFITESGHIKLGDFGIARIESSQKTRVGAVLGTPSHMAPEQIRGEGADARSDLYAAGVVLYQFLTGERPFTGTMLSMALKVLNEPAPRPSSVRPGLPPALDAVLARALAKRPDERYQTAADFWRALAEGSGLGPGGDLPAGPALGGSATAGGFGRSGFGDTGFGHTGFGDTGFGRSGFGDTGVGQGRSGDPPPADTAPGRADRGDEGGLPPMANDAAPTLRPRAGGTVPPQAPSAPLPSTTPPEDPAQAAPAGEAARGAPRGAAAGPKGPAWLIGGIALVALVAGGWWAFRPTAPAAVPPAPTVTPPTTPASVPSSSPSPTRSATPSPAPSAAPPVAAPAASPVASSALPPTVQAIPASAVKTGAPASAGTDSRPTAEPTPPAPKPPVRTPRDTRATTTKPVVEPAAPPTPKAPRPARCSDILQKASLEPLTSEEATYLRRECQ